MKDELDRELEEMAQRYSETGNWVESNECETAPIVNWKKFDSAIIMAGNWIWTFLTFVGSLLVMVVTSQIAAMIIGTIVFCIGTFAYLIFGSLMVFIFTGDTGVTAEFFTNPMTWRILLGSMLVVGPMTVIAVIIRESL